MATKKAPPKLGSAARPWDATRVQKYRENLALRKHLPDKFLTPTQRRARALNTRLDAPLTPGGDGTTVRQFARDRKAQEKLQFGTTLSDLRIEKERLDNQRARDTQYFQNYKQQVTDAANRQAQVAADANAAAVSTSQAAVKDSQAAIDQKVEAAKADAAQRGLPFNEAVFRDIAQRAQGSRQEQMQGQVANQARSGVAQSSFLTGLESGASLGIPRVNQQHDQKIKALHDVAQTVRDKKAAWNESFYQNAVNESRKRQLENQAYGLDVAKAKLGAEADANKLQADADAAAQKRADEAGKVNAYGYTNADWAKLSTKERQSIILRFKKTGKTAGGKNGSKPPFMSNTDQGKSWLKIAQAVGFLKTHVGKSKGPDGKPLNLAALHTAPPDQLTAIVDVSDPRYTAAVDVFTTGGYISQSTAALLHQAGLQVKGRYKVISNAQARALAKQRQANGYR